jgi:cytidylate kinase
VFITAPFEMRARRIMELEGISYKDASKRLAKRDASREEFYRFYTGKIWGNASNYDLCINSASYGIQESVDLILRILNKEAKKNN